MKNIIIIIFVACFMSYLLSQTEESFPVLAGPYLGQNPPGIVPEVFAPGIVSDSTWAEHCQVAISPNCDEIFWSAWTAEFKSEDGSKNTEQIYHSCLKKGKWTKPKLAEFTKNNRHGLNGGPVFSPDGKRIYFYQVKSPWVSSDKNTYYVEKIGGMWSTEPIDVGQPYNTEAQDNSPIFTRNGIAYKNQQGKISKYSYDNDSFTLRDTLIIHEDFRPLWNFFMSPNEDYVIFSALHESGFGDIDLYISFKCGNGKWGYPINMGNKVNTELRERFPTVSPDGKYMFFMRHTPGQDFFWVSTKIIHELQAKAECIK